MAGKLPRDHRVCPGERVKRLFKMHVDRIAAESFPGGERRRFAVGIEDAAGHAELVPVLEHALDGPVFLRVAAAFFGVPVPEKAAAVVKTGGGEDFVMPVVGRLKPVAEIALAVELLSCERGERFNGIDIIGIVPVLKKPEPSRQSGLERGTLRRGHAFEIERPPLLRGTRAERVNGGDEIAPAGGVSVKRAAGAKVFNAQPLAEQGNISPAENIPEKNVSEAVRGAFGTLPGERFVNKGFVLQTDGLKFAHKNDLSGW